jgi:hypothetical protein
MFIELTNQRHNHFIISDKIELLFLLLKVNLYKKIFLFIIIVVIVIITTTITAKVLDC